MLTLEALFTALLARLIYGETMDRRVWSAMLLLLTGGIVLVLDFRAMPQLGIATANAMPSDRGCAMKERLADISGRRCKT